MYLVLEYVNFDLSQLLAKENELIEKQAVTIAYNMLLAVRSLHSMGVIHRDLKPSNILINEYCNVVLADFGLARSWHTVLPAQTQRQLSPRCFSKRFRPPELFFERETYDQSADLWSLGCIFFDMFSKVMKPNSSKSLFSQFIKESETS